MSAAGRTETGEALQQQAGSACCPWLQAREAQPVHTSGYCTNPLLVPRRAAGLEHTAVRVAMAGMVMSVHLPQVLMMCQQPCDVCPYYF